MSFEETFEQRQLDAREKIVKMVKKAEPYTRFYIDDVPVTKEQYLAAIEMEGGHKLPFAYSKHTVTFYLLTRKNLGGKK